MVCIYCASLTRVVNSRTLHRIPGTWRRRECQNCRNVFTTTETVEYSTALVMKTGKALRPFARDELFLSVYECLKHRKSALADAQSLTDTIIGKMVSQTSDAQIERDFLVDLSQETIKRFDRAAAVQYLAYHPLSK